MTLHLDISHVVHAAERGAGFAGVHRVALEIAREMPAAAGDADVRLCAHPPGGGALRAVRAAALCAGGAPGPAELRAAFATPGARADLLPPSLERYADRPVRRALQHAHRRLRAGLGDRGHFERRGTSLAAWHAHCAPQAVAARARLRALADAADARPLAAIARPGDRLIVLAGGWRRSGTAEIEALRAAGVGIDLLVHDVLPLTHPEHFREDARREYRDWLARSAVAADRLLVTSRYTEGALRDLWPTLAPGAEMPALAVVPLAHRLPPAAREGPVGAEVGPEIGALAARPFVLCVGTMEGRKNNLGLARAWQMLVSGAVDGVAPEAVPTLVFAGRRGWLNEAFFAFLERTEHLGGRIRLVEGPSDAELAALYEASLFTAMVSHAEGWGLPVGESLGHGKVPVVARSTALPEVGGDLALYCDAADPGSIAAACARLIADPADRARREARIAATRLRDWGDVARELLAGVFPP